LGSLLRCDTEFGLENRERYLSMQPFPHIVIDDFIDGETLIQACEYFPAPSTVKWTQYNNPLEKKLMYSEYEGLDISLTKVLGALNSPQFLLFLENLTGFQNIIKDDQLVGGGLHQIEKEGKLDIHADFNIHYQTGNRRCLNLILFLNKDWKEDYGGHLELWDREMKKCRRRVLPIFNRVVIFSTDETSYHGHPHPLTCPEGRTRKSIALYYYIKNHDNVKSHSTKYMKRPTEPEDEELDEFRRIRSIPKDQRNK